SLSRGPRGGCSQNHRPSKGSCPLRRRCGGCRSKPRSSTAVIFDRFQRRQGSGSTRDRPVEVRPESREGMYAPTPAGHRLQFRPMSQPLMLGPVPVDFLLFALILAGIAFFQDQTFRVAVTGLAVVTLYKIAFTGFPQGAGVAGFVGLLGHEWVTLANLFFLLMGFALLSKHFEDSNVPIELPKILPDDWKGGFMLLAMIFVLSSFLDNIAAALIGGTIASGVFRGKVHIGYLAAIVAASNAGGSGSVVGDTTTTMMWIAGVSPLSVLEAYVAAGSATLIFGVIAAKQQHAYSHIMKDPPAGIRVDWARVGIVAFILVVAIVANVVANVDFPE